MQFINKNRAAKLTVFNTFFTISPPRRYTLSELLHEGLRAAEEAPG